MIKILYLRYDVASIQLDTLIIYHVFGDHHMIPSGFNYSLHDSYDTAKIRVKNFKNLKTFTLILAISLESGRDLLNHLLNVSKTMPFVSNYSVTIEPLFAAHLLLPQLTFSSIAQFMSKSMLFFLRALPRIFSHHERHGKWRFNCFQFRLKSNS